MNSLHQLIVPCLEQGLYSWRTNRENDWVSEQIKEDQWPYSHVECEVFGQVWGIG